MGLRRSRSGDDTLQLIVPPSQGLVSLAMAPGEEESAHHSPCTPAGRARPVPRHTSYDQILYTGGVQAHWRESTVGEHGELVLEGLPFSPGHPVEVLVVSKTATLTTTGGGGLRDSVLEFREPLEPVAGEDWDALQ